MKVGVVGVVGGGSSERLADAVADRTGYRLLISLDAVWLDVESGCVRFGDLDLASLDGLVVKKVGAVYSPMLLDRFELLRFLAERGLPIFSDPRRAVGLLDRLSCTVSLRSAGLPLPPTVVTEDAEVAAAAVERYGQAVLKPLYTSKARGMRLVEGGPGARDTILAFQEAGNPVLYVQKRVEVPGQDLGVVFLGGRYLATYARVRGEDSWNTTRRAGGRYEAYEPPAEVIALAERAQALFGLDFTSVDIVETSDGPMVFEVSAFGGFSGLRDAHGIDAARLFADHVIDKLEE